MAHDGRQNSGHPPNRGSPGATPEALATFFRSHGEMLARSAFSEMADQFLLPTAIYLDGRPVVIADVQAFGGALQRLQKQRCDGGLAAVIPELSVEPQNRNRRTPVTVDWTFLDAAGDVCCEDRIRYFLVFVSGEPKIEMAELLSLPSIAAALPDEQGAVH